MTNKQKYTIVSALVIGVFMGAALTWYIVVGSSNGVENSKPEYSLEAVAFFNEYNKNKEQANDKFNGKIIEVSGNIAEMFKNKDSEMTIILRNNQTFTGISCTLENSDKQIKKPLKIGSLITIKGKCTGKANDVILTNCYIVKTE